MHQPFDEFSVADLRQTIEQLWRIVAGRRWWFIIPSAAVAALAFFASGWLPRRYSVSTSFERRRDVVLANLGRGWTEALDAVRATMLDDLRDSSAWRSAAAELGVTGDLGSLLGGLDVSLAQPEPNREVITLTLDGSDPVLFPALLRGVRDQYLAVAGRRTTEVLEGARQFIAGQVDATQAKLVALESQIADLERRCPALTEEGAASVRDEIGALTRESRALVRRETELAERLAYGQRRLDRLGAPAANPAPAVPRTHWIDNPQRDALIDALEKIQVELWECRRFKGMTDAHPKVQTLLVRLGDMQSELERIPAQIEVPLESPPEAPAAQGTALIEQMARIDDERSAAELAREQSAARSGEIECRVAELTALRAEADRLRPEYAALTERIAAGRAEVNAWRTQIEPIERILTVQAGNRGVLMRPLTEPHAATHPISPNPRTVLFVCIVIALAAGALGVFSRELSDRSCRNVTHLASVAGVQVLQAIDEIITPAARRRRLLRHAFVLPVTATALAAIALLSGMGAYRSLTDPARTPRWFSTYWGRPPARIAAVPRTPQEPIPDSARASAAD